MIDPKDAMCAKMLAESICPRCGRSVLVKMSDYTIERSNWDEQERESSWLRSWIRWIGRMMFIPQDARLKETAARIIEGMKDGSVTNA